MTKDKFISICIASGYCNKETAEAYTKHKRIFTSDDFIEVWRISERQIVLRNGICGGKYRYYQGVKSTKYLPCGVNE